jgi:hypothetical protein
MGITPLSQTLAKINGGKKDNKALNQNGTELGRALKGSFYLTEGKSGEAGWKTLQSGSASTLYPNINHPLWGKTMVTGKPINGFNISASLNWNDKNGNNKVDADEKQDGVWVTTKGYALDKPKDQTIYKYFDISTSNNSSIISNNKLSYTENERNNTWRTTGIKRNSTVFKGEANTFGNDFIAGLFGS